MGNPVASAAIVGVLVNPMATASMPLPPPSLGMAPGQSSGPAHISGLLGPTSPQITQQQLQRDTITKALSTIQAQVELAKGFAKQFPEASKPIQLILSGWHQVLTQIVSSQRPQAGGAPNPPA